nr:MAG TPA: tail tape measure protein [Caudoviricetes sp.]
MAVPVELEIFMKDLTKAGLQSVGKNVDDVENQTQKLISALKQVIAEQKKQLEVNKIAGLSYTQEVANIQALTGQVRGLEAGLNSLKKTKEVAAKTPSIDIDTEAVTRKTNNLKMQFSQVARELPSLAMGPQMFILAISNNLPMLADAISDVRKQNELLAASGQKGVPVWKQLAGAVFSWQTALVAAISLGIVFGKDIMDWVKNLGKANKELSETQKLQQAVNTSHREGGKAASEESAKLKILYTASQDSSKSMKERNKAVDELQKMYPSYFGKLTNEAILAGKAASAYDDLTKAIIRKGQAQAAEDIVADYSKQNFQLQRNINADTNWTNRNKAEYEKALKEREKMWENYRKVNQGSIIVDSAAKAWISNTPEGKLIEEYERRMSNIKKYTDQIAKNNKIIEGTVKQIDTSAYIDDGLDGNYSKSTKEKTDYASQLADARVKAQQTTEKLRLQIMLEGIAKRKALAKQEYDDSIADIDKQERDTLAKMDKARKQGDNIPQSQYDSVKQEAQTQRILAQQVYNEQIFQIEKEYQDKSSQSLIDYYKEYGTYQEKKLAIAQDYARKIAAAETEGEVKTLTRQRDDKLASLDFEEMKKGMDWEKIFGDLDKVSTDTLERLREKLKQYLEGIGDDISPESFKEVMDAFNNLDTELADRSPFEAMKKGYEDYMSAMEEVRAAENLLQQTRMGGSVIVEEYDEYTGTLTRKLVTQAEAEERLRAAQDKRYSAQKSLTEAVNSIGQKGEAVVSAGNDIVDMLTALGISVPDAMQDVLGGLGTVMSSMASIDLTKPFSILTGITGTLKGIGQTIGGLFGLGSDSTERYEKLRESLEAMNELYDKIISKEKENISFGGGFGAMASAEKAQKALNAQIENLQQLASAASGAGSGLFKHSYGYRTNEAIGSGGYREISSLIGKNIDDVSDLFTLTGDELYEIMSQLPGVWNNIDGNIRQYLEDIVELKDESLEIQDALNEALTGVGRDSFYNSFIDQLADMETSWEDMCGNFEDELRKSILAGLVSSQYQSQIDALYNKWAEAARSGGKIDEKEAGNLRSEYQRIVKSLMNERDKMAETFGWEEEEDEGSSQSPSSGALTTMSQDSISTFEGIGRNMQTHLANTDKFVQEIRNTQKQDSQTLATIAGHTAHLVEIHEILSDMKLNGITLK